MAIENMGGMLRKAQKEGYAVGAFNILDYSSMKAVVKAAEEERAPVIIQTSAKTVRLWGPETMISWFHDTAKNASVPVAIHLDHCKDLDLIRACIDAGWTSVMIDASAKPFEENLRLSKQVVEMAAPKNVSVEAELGKIGGVEDDISVADEDAHLVDPDEALRFCNELKLSCFAPAIGTAHGVYKGEPKIAFDRLDRVADETGVPIALHGGTGLSVEVFKKSISHGAAKVNISTQLKHAFIDSFVEYYKAHRDEYNPLKNIQEQIDCVKKEVRENIVFFGSNGRV